MQMDKECHRRHLKQCSRSLYQNAFCKLFLQNSNYFAVKLLYYLFSEYFQIIKDNTFQNLEFPNHILSLHVLTILCNVVSRNPVTRETSTFFSRLRPSEDLGTCRYSKVKVINKNTQTITTFAIESSSHSNPAI